MAYLYTLPATNTLGIFYDTIPPAGHYFDCTDWTDRNTGSTAHAFSQVDLDSFHFSSIGYGLPDGILSCSPISSSFSWFLTYSAIQLSFFPTVST